MVARTMAAKVPIAASGKNRRVPRSTAKAMASKVGTASKAKADLSTSSSTLAKGFFPSSSYLTTPVNTSGVLDTNSAAMASRIANGNSIVINYDYSNPIYVATGGEPTYSVIVDNDNANGGTWGTCDITGKSIPIATGWVENAGGDHKLTVISGNTVYDLAGAYKTGGVWHCYWGGVYTLNGSGVSSGPNAYQSKPTGSGFSNCGGIITLDDARKQRIDHALCFATQWTANSSTYRLPASTSDGSNSGYAGSDAIPEGARFFLPPTYNPSTTGWPLYAKMILACLKTYGMYCSDVAGAPTGAVIGRQLVTALDGTDPWSSIDADSSYDVFGWVNGSLSYIDLSQGKFLRAWDGS